MAILMVSLFSFIPVAWSAITISDVAPADVTPSGFAIVWQTSGSATPGISVYTDPDGLNDITNQVEITPFPLFSGNPALTDEYARDEDMDHIRSQAMSKGIMKIRVEGCTPGTTYYYRISATGTDGSVASWPATGLASITTPEENSFVADSKQILITVDTQGGTIDPAGWLVIAEAPASEGTFSGVSSFVGDGAPSNQAFIDLSNIFGSDGLNWSPLGTRNITLKILRGWNMVPVYKTIALDFTSDYHVASVYMVTTEPDTDNDGIPDSWEMDKFGNLTTADAFTDYDSDGLSDRLEYVHGTDPFNPDSDGDGLSDGYEVVNNLDPLDDGTTNPDNGPSGDPDHDGYTNQDEYLAGSGAFNGNSFPVSVDIVLHKGFNIFGYPVTEAGGLTSYDLLTLLGDETEIEKIMIYDRVSGIYHVTYYDMGAPVGDNVDIHYGDGIIVYSRVEKTISFNPSVRPFNSYVECVPVDLYTGMNLVTFPCVPSGYTAFQLLEAISSASGSTEAVNTVQTFNPDTGQFFTAGYMSGVPVGIDFPIEPGKGYYIYMNQDLPEFSP